MEVIDALHNMGNETERNAIASDLFGKSYQSLNPLIVSGTETLQGYMEAAKENYNLTVLDSMTADDLRARPGGDEAVVRARSMIGRATWVCFGSG